LVLVTIAIKQAVALVTTTKFISPFALTKIYVPKSFLTPL
jgi:hypothetical protein